jgi:uncharacterized protein YdaU (DUF1376 family)
LIPVPKREVSPPAAVSFLGELELETLMHYYQFHIGDYKSHTHHLSLLEDLAYRRLLDFYFLHENPIKHRDIARQIGMREHEEDVMTVLNEFFISTADGFVNPRADKEIKQYKEFSVAGKRGAAKRWGTPPNGEATSPPNATPIATNNHKPITINQEPDISICPPSGEPDDPKIPKCEHQSVIDMYHKYLPTLRKVEVWNTARQGYLRQRWREVALELSKEKDIVAADILTWFGDFFQHIGTSKFLIGKVNSKDGRAFTADLEWILKPSNFAKIVEGKYHGAN